MEECSDEQHPSKSMQSLPQSLQSLVGFNSNFTPSWIESVSYIINELSSTRAANHSDTKSRILQKTKVIGYDDEERDTSVSQIQDELAALHGQLKQLTLQRRHKLNDYLDLKGNIRVFCRIRPFLPDENCGRSLLTLDSNSVFLRLAETKSKQYKFDKVFHPNSKQDEVFAEIQPMIKSALDGYNICIFAYGQTGTGKTYTMEGSPEEPGVIPRGIQALFDQAARSNYRFQFTFSMLEIYLGNLQDLLVSKSNQDNAKKTPCPTIQRNTEGEIEIENLVAVDVNGFEEVKRLYEAGTRLRSTASTMANSRSSRSHCLIRILLTCLDAPERRRVTNKLWMIDLGGSERLLKTRATGRRLQEGKAINLSLTALGDVIDALHTKKAHVPYRNSKLTQVLTDSLGYDSKVLMLVHVSPNEDDLCEAICSLGFATRVRSIQLDSEEPPEVKARKERSLAEVEQKLKKLEGECQDITRSIKILNEKMEHLRRAQQLCESNLDVSYQSNEDLHSVIAKEAKSSRTCKEVSARTPKFMKPTTSSKRRIVLTSNTPITTQKKPPVPPKKRPSSVYAESVGSLPKDVHWQSECSSNCSISTTSEMNWMQSIEDGTESSATEDEIKQVIFPDQDISPGGLMIKSSDSQVGKSEILSTKKAKDRSNIDIDHWLHLQTTDMTTCPTKRGIAIPEENEECNSSTTSSIGMQKVTSGSKITMEDIFSPKSQKNSVSVKSWDAKFCNSQEQEECAEESFIPVQGPRRSLLQKLDNCMQEQLDGGLEVEEREVFQVARAPVNKFQEKNHVIGKLKLLLQYIWIVSLAALLGLGIQRSGLGPDFFHGLIQ